MELSVIQSKIYAVRDTKVMLDRDLAGLYGVETRVLNQAVKRNIERFPEDFMFRLSKAEAETLKSQTVTLDGNLMSQNVISRWGGTRKLPYAFTELGVAMLSSVLKSSTAIQINISIMRAFVMVRQMLRSQPSAEYEELSAEVKELRDYVDEILADQNDINENTNVQLELINEAIARLETDNCNNVTRKKIGFLQ